MADPLATERCALCGWVGRFPAVDEDRNAGSDYPCGGCDARLRYRDEATVFVEQFGDETHTSLHSLLEAPSFATQALLFVGITGPLRRLLSGLAGYCESTLEPPLTGRQRPVRRSYQDLQHLGFATSSFDTIFSSHVMEHVPEPALAFDEARRVLKPGGTLLFSLPLVDRAESIARCRFEAGELVHLLEPNHHRSPQGPALVFTDFGNDVVDQLREHGFDASIRRVSSPPRLYFNAVVTATLVAP